MKSTLSYWEEQQKRNERQQQWLDGLKAGDEVAIRYSLNYSSHYRLAKVERRTATQLVIDDARYRTKNGLRCGDNSGTLTEPTPELKQQIADESERRTLLTQIDRIRWKTLDLEHLRAVAAVLPKPQETVADDNILAGKNAGPALKETLGAMPDFPEGETK